MEFRPGSSHLRERARVETPETSTRLKEASGSRAQGHDRSEQVAFLSRHTSRKGPAIRRPGNAHEEEVGER